MMEHELIVSPHIRKDGRFSPLFDVVCNGVLLCVTEWALCDGARALLALGKAVPSDRMIMRHAESDTIAMSGGVVLCAQLMGTEEDRGGLRLRKYRGYLLAGSDQDAFEGSRATQVARNGLNEHSV